MDAVGGDPWVDGDLTYVVRFVRNMYLSKRRLHLHTWGISQPIPYNRQMTTTPLNVDQQAIQLAQAHLSNYSPTEQSSKIYAGRGLYLEPKVVAQAALDCAPSEQGKLRMAQLIMETVDKSTGMISHHRIKEFARRIFNDLLVPCMFLYLRY